MIRYFLLIFISVFLSADVYVSSPHSDYVSSGCPRCTAGNGCHTISCDYKKLGDGSYYYVYKVESLISDKLRWYNNDPRIYVAVCPPGTEFDNTGDEAVCRCPSGKVSVAVEHCPDDGKVEYTCGDPCEVHSRRQHSGSCIPEPFIEYCNVDVPAWQTRCPFNMAKDSSGECVHCSGGYPNADSSDCSSCSPDYEDVDGTCTDKPCAFDAPYYYPISETSKRYFTNDADGNAVPCYDSGNDNNSTGGNSTGNSSGNDNNSTGGNSTGNSSGNDNNSTGGNSTGNSSGNSGSGLDTTSITDQLKKNQNSIDGVKKSIDGANKTLGDIKGAVTSNGKKLNDINKSIGDLSKNFKSDGSDGYFEGLIETGKALKNTYIITKQNFDNLIALYKGGFEKSAIQKGSFSGFTLDIYGRNVQVNPCQYASNFAPIVALIIQLSLLLSSIYLFVWGVKS